MASRLELYVLSILHYLFAISWCGGFSAYRYNQSHDYWYDDFRFNGFTRYLSRCEFPSSPILIFSVGELRTEGAFAFASSRNVSTTSTCKELLKFLSYSSSSSGSTSHFPSSLFPHSPLIKNESGMVSVTCDITWTWKSSTQYGTNLIWSLTCGGVSIQTFEGGGCLEEGLELERFLLGWSKPSQLYPFLPLFVEC